MTNFQLILSISIPSLLVILSWIQNNTRLSRVEAAQDVTNRRIDDLQRTQHSDMLTLLGEMGRVREEMSKLRERVTLIETATR